jgi:hypothetical protein
MADLPYPPWDVPPISAQGDSDEDSTYAGVGRVLSEWEAVEAELAHLYARFGGRLFQDEAYYEYGASRIFAERLRDLRKAASSYFVKRPNQTAEGNFDFLAEEAERYAARRNDIAHCVVRDLSIVSDFGTGFWLVPSFYAFRRFGRSAMPAFAYTSIELGHLKDGLWELRARIAVYHQTF